MIKNGLGLALLLAATTRCEARSEEFDAFQGVIEFDERGLGFEVGGRVETIAVQEGDRVEADAALASLDAGLERAVRAARRAEAQAAKSQAQLVRAGPRAEDVQALAAQVQGVQATESLLEKNLAREQTLLGKGVSTPAAVDEIEARLEATRAERQSLLQKLRALRSGSRPEEIVSAEARAEAAQQAVELTNERLQRHELRAERGGLVLDVHVEPGEIVSPGAPVLTLGDTLHPYADIFVPQDELGGIAVGTPATVRVDATPEPFSGKVENVARRTEFTPRFLFSERERPNLVIRVRVRIDDPQQRLHAGVPAFVTLAAGAPAEAGGER